MSVGWKEVPFEQCLERFRVPAKVPKKQFASEGPFPIVSQEADFINGFWRDGNDVCRIDRPVVIYGDHTQVVKYVDFDFVVGADGVKVLQPKDFIDPKYLYYFVMAHRVPSLGYARHYRHLKEQALCHPALEEQRRIVAVLDEAFEGLARARAHAEANLESAQSFFLSVLRHVFRNGSRKWETKAAPDNVVAVGASAARSRSRAATQTGGRGATLRAIPGPYSLSVLRPADEARQGWTWTALTDLARLESGHTPSRKHPEYWGGEVPWIGIKDARDHHGTTITETLENTNELGIANSSARILPENTVCLSRTASVGYVTVMGRDMATSQDFVNWICGPALLPGFLKFLLLAQGDDIRRFASGSVHQTIYFPEVKAFHICHPPVEVQKEICASLEQVAQESQRLISAYQTKLTDIDELRQSVLQAAFSGKLT